MIRTKLIVLTCLITMTSTNIFKLGLMTLGEKMDAHTYYGTLRNALNVDVNVD